MERLTDSTLMRLVQGGDATQLAELFERYHLALFRYLLQLSRDRALSEDLVQEVFFRVLKYAGSFDAAQSFPVWLYRMARNAYFDAIRKRRPELLTDEWSGIESPAPAPDTLSLQREDAAYLQEALAQLSPDKREVLMLSRFHNLRHHEIAQILKCEIGTVKVRVYRALKELREKFCELQMSPRSSARRSLEGGEELYDV